MKHPDNEHNDNNNERDLFARLEADLAADFGSAVVDLDKARAARDTSADTGPAAPDSGSVESSDATADRSADSRTVRTPDGSADSRPDSVPDASGTGRPKLADSPAVSGPGYLERVRGAKRIPVVPVWLSSGKEFADASKWVGGHLWHTVWFHAFRSPLYVGKLALRTPAGAARAVSRVGRWTADAEGEPLRQAEARRENSEVYLKLSRQRDRRVRLRVGVTLISGLGMFGAGLFLAFGASPLTQAIAAALAVGTFGWLGAPADAPISSRAVVKTEVQKLTSDMVVKAMASIGVGQIATAVAKRAQRHHVRRADHPRGSRVAGGY